MKRTSSSPVASAPSHRDREKEKILATRHGPDQFKHLDKVLTNMGRKHGSKMACKPLYERFSGAAGNRISRKYSNVLVRLALRTSKRRESTRLGTNYYLAAMNIATSDQLPHVKKAAEEFMTMVVQQNGELLYTPQLARLVNILAHPEETKPQATQAPLLESAWAEIHATADRLSEELGFNDDPNSKL